MEGKLYTGWEMQQERTLVSETNSLGRQRRKGHQAAPLCPSAASPTPLASGSYASPLPPLVPPTHATLGSGSLQPPKNKGAI